MKTYYFYRLDTQEDKEKITKLEKLGVKFFEKTKQSKILPAMVNLYIYTDDPLAKDVVQIMKGHKYLSAIGTEFSKEDYDNANLLKMEPDWLHQYPQPEDTHIEWESIVYDLSKYCSECGVGKIQKAPFHMRREPQWGNRHIFGLNWVFDEFFVKPGIWEIIFKPKKIDCLPVIQHRTGLSMKTVVQLKINKVLETSLEMEDYPFEVCKVCKRKKYSALSVGYFPRPKSFPKNFHIVRSQEYFGSGAEARNAVLISKELYSEIKKEKLKSLEFKVVKN